MRRRGKWNFFSVFSAIFAVIVLGYGGTMIALGKEAAIKSNFLLAIHALRDIFGVSGGSEPAGKEVSLDGASEEGDGDARFATETVPYALLQGTSGVFISKKKSKQQDALGTSVFVAAKIESSTPSATEGSSSVKNSIKTPACGSSCEISIIFTGSGRGMVTSTPPGILCDGGCSWGFSRGGTVVLRATPDLNSIFGGWAGACSGKKETCIFSPSSSVSLILTFLSKPAGASSVAANTGVAVVAPAVSIVSPAILPSPPDSLVVETSSAGVSDAVVPGHLLIAAVQIGGASSSNDLIRIFNPTSGDVDMGGWRLRKRSETGAEYSIRQLPRGTVLARGKIFEWANSVGGFSESIGADTSSSETLSANNSVALLDASGTIVDAVAWGTGTNQFGEGNPFATNPAAGNVLGRKMVGGIMQDTNDNENDFSL